MAALEERLRKQEQWAAEHDGRINAKWEAQDKNNDEYDVALKELNDKVDSGFKKLFHEVTTIKTKVAMYATLAVFIATFAAKYLLP